MHTSLMAWYSLLSLLAVLAVSRAACCWDSDGYRLTCYNIRDDCSLWKVSVCRNGQSRVGSYCSQGSCNVFGCDCDGGCIGSLGDAVTCESFGPKWYSSSDAAEDGRQNSPDCECYKPGTGRTCVPRNAKVQNLRRALSEDSDLNAIGKCQQAMVKRYNTSSLTSPAQIGAYFDCLESTGDGVLGSGDDAMMVLQSLNVSVEAIDSNGDGVIQREEFDPQLPEGSLRISRGSHATYGMVALALVLFAWLP